MGTLERENSKRAAAKAKNEELARLLGWAQVQAMDHGEPLDFMVWRRPDGVKFNDWHMPNWCDNLLAIWGVMNDLAADEAFPAQVAEHIARSYTANYLITRFPADAAALITDDLCKILAYFREDSNLLDGWEHKPFKPSED